MSRRQKRHEAESRLSLFAKTLGWPELRQFVKTFDDLGRTVVWFEAGNANFSRTHCALQINEHPLGSSRSFTAAVHCIRYRISSGFHCFACENLREALSEAERLSPWLAREWFTSAVRRREYRLAHPECAGYTWKKLREAGESHYP